MHWLVFATLAYFVWATNNLIAKVLISKHIPGQTIYIIALGTFSFLPLLLVPLRGLVIPPLPLLGLALVTGILYVVVLAPYYQALQLEEASRVIPLWRFTPLFVLLFSGNLIGESLNFPQFLAFFGLGIGGFLVSLKKLDRQLLLSPAFYLMLFSSLIAGLYNTLTKLIYLNLPYLDAFTWIRLGTAIGAFCILLLPQKRLEVVNILRNTNSTFQGWLAFHEGLNFTGLIFHNIAVTLAPISLVSASSGIQPIFVLGLSVLLTFIRPDLIQEDLRKTVILQKVGAIGLIVIGTIILSLYS